MCYYALISTTRVCVCVCEPADQLYRKDARYRGYLTWYIFRRHVYLPYLTLPTYKQRELQMYRDRGRAETFQQNVYSLML